MPLDLQEAVKGEVKIEAVQGAVNLSAPEKKVRQPHRHGVKGHSKVSLPKKQASGDHTHFRLPATSNCCTH